MVFINGIGCNFNLGKFKSEKLTELFCSTRQEWTDKTFHWSREQSRIVKCKK